MVGYYFIVFKYHVSVGIKIGVTFIFRLHRRPIQLVVFVELDNGEA